MDGWMDGWVKLWKNGKMDRWMSEYWMDDRRMEEWAVGYVD